MKKTNIVILLLILTLFFVGPARAEVEFSEELFVELAEGTIAIPEIEIPDYRRVELDNGMIFYLSEDDELPVVELRGYILGGRSQETQETAGVANIMAHLMNTGTQNFSERELIRYKELNGLELNISSGRDRFSFSGSALIGEQQELYSLLAEKLRNPRFDGDYFQRIIQESYQGVMQGYYDEDSLLAMYFNKNIYGEKHPYSFGSNLDLLLSTLQQLTPDKVERFYRKTVDPSQIIIAISGDIEIEETVALLEEEFTDWESKNTKLKDPAIVLNSDNFNRILLVNKEDATHAKMRMGYNFYDSSFEKRAAFRIGDRIFGGGDFSSRLVDNLRVQRGYVYAAYSVSSYNQLGGVYYITTDVDPGKAYITMAEIKQEMEAISRGRDPITEEEVDNRLNLFNALYPQSFTSRIGTLNHIMYNIEVRERGEDPINEYIQEINALTANEVQQVFADYSFPHRFLTVIVGNKDDILPAFEEQGLQVEVVDAF